MCKVSIIVPVYNASNYIEACVASLLGQTLKDIEIILINDGSTDNSGDICDNYATNNNNVRVIHQKNSGPGASRNNGIAIAKGEYIAFADSDDWIEDSMLEEMYAKTKNGSIDLVICQYFMNYCTTNTYEIIEMDGIPANIVVGKEVIRDVICRSLLESGIHAGLCNKLYKIELFNSPENKMIEDKNYGEDWRLLLDIFDKTSRLVYIDKPFYHYLHRQNDSLTKKYVPDAFESIGLWMYETRKIYAKKWNLPIDGAASHFAYQVWFYITSEFDRNPTKRSFGKYYKCVREYLFHPIVEEAFKLGNLKFNFCKTNFALFLIKKKQTLLICIFLSSRKIFKKLIL